MRKIFGLMALALCSALITPASATTIVNGGFETGSLTPWAQGSDHDVFGIDWAIESSDTHSGAFAAITTGGNELFQNFAPIAVSAIQELSLWLKFPSGFGISAIYLHYTDPSQDNIYVAIPLGTADWEQYDLTSTLLTGLMLKGISIYGYDGGSSPPITELDDVVLRATSDAVPEPITLALFGAGLAGMGALRRRKRN